MVERNLALYRITVGENRDFHIPFLRYRGTPTGIDIFKVVETGVTPVMGRPSKLKFPLVSGSVPEMALSVVVLPAPLAPMSATISFGGT